MSCAGGGGGGCVDGGGSDGGGGISVLSLDLFLLTVRCGACSAGCSDSRVLVIADDISGGVSIDLHSVFTPWAKKSKNESIN